MQIILFATLAIEYVYLYNFPQLPRQSTNISIRLKRRAPNAHTFLEAVRARYGKAAHLVFLTFGLMTNILVTAMLVTGGRSVTYT